MMAGAHLRALLLTVLSLSLVPLRAAAQSPILVTGDGTQGVVLTGLPAVLGIEEIREELHSGLTNTLLLLVTVDPDSGAKLRGAATVDIRYELWDEVYLIAVTERDGRSRHETIDSFEALLGWWQDLRLDILAPGSVAADRDSAAEVELSLLPFSQAEQRDAQLWLTRSVSDTASAEPATDDPARVEQRVGESTDRVLDILVATSIKRRSVYRYQWVATIAERRVGEPEDNG